MYVKNFMIQQEIISQQSNAEQPVVSEVQNLNFQKSKKRTSRSTKNELLEVQNLDPNNTYSNNTELNNTDSNPIVSMQERTRCDKGFDEEIYFAYQKLVKENIDFDSLMDVYPLEKETIQGIYDLIVETMMTSNDKILIASSWYPSALVKSKFMKLTYTHIEYVIDMLNSNTTKVRNIKKYILASLFNAPNTIDSYYRAEVNHDMPQFAKAR